MKYTYSSQTLAYLALMLSLGVLFLGCGGDIHTQKATHLQRGEAYVAKEKYQEASIEFTNAMKLDPKDAQVHYKLALAYLKQGTLPQLQQAFQALQASVALDPSLLEAQLKMGELYLLDNRFDEAQAQATLVLQRDPHNV